MIPVPAASAGPSNHISGHSDDDSLMPTPTATPVECFITTEADLDNAAESSAQSSSRLYSPRKNPHDVVRRPQLHTKPRANNADIADSWLHSLSTASCASSEAGNSIRQQDYLQPLTPGLASLSGNESAISSASSRRDSLTASSFHDSFPPSLVDFVAHRSASPHETMTGSGPGPQLVMPSLTVPRRRPFSVIGRSIGKLKLLITGSAGIGKTSFIQSMAQACEHIVHIDPIDPAASGGVTEVYASTKPHSWWQSNSDSTTAARRRMSSTDEILSRNICFVEAAPADENTQPATKYLESSLLPMLSKSVGDSDLACILSSGAEPIVDAVLYLLPFTGPTSGEIEDIERLNTMTNVIPVIGHADELVDEALLESKERVVQVFEDHGIDYFSFMDSPLMDPLASVYAISSATRPDSQLMDASVLMSSDYMPPLLSSELGKLAGFVFSPEGSAQLRHSAALKCVKWRGKQGMDADLRFALCHRQQSLNYAVTPVLTANPYGQHPFWRRVEISNWAQDLRQSLEGERLCRLSQMTPGAARHGTAAPDTQLAIVGRKKSRRRSKRVQASINQDPLGLIQLVTRVHNGGQVSLEFLSSIGALGCLVAWLYRSGANNQGDMVLWPGWSSTL
ncbi:cell division/GTP binding protein [Paramyrothecium foliicola]|nr:cell division/GTP binding protein [Paramyrothecium foliicola]